MNGKTIWREARFLALILFGSACYAVGFDLFLMPHQVNAGGVSGAAMLICAALGWHGGVGILTFAINIPLFILGYRYLGRRFFYGSVIGMLASSALIELVARIDGSLHFRIFEVLHKRTRHRIYSLETVLYGCNQFGISILVNACYISTYGMRLRYGRPEFPEIGVANADDIVVEVSD